MTNQEYYTQFEKIVEDLSKGGADSLTKSISILMNLAMCIERDNAIGAGAYERTEERKGHRNGFKDKTLKTRICTDGMVVVWGGYGFLCGLVVVRDMYRIGTEYYIGFLAG